MDSERKFLSSLCILTSKPTYTYTRIYRHIEWLITVLFEI